MRRVRPVTINGGVSMRAWYDILGAQIADRQDEAGMRVSIGQLDELIAREGARGIPAERVGRCRLLAGRRDRARRRRAPRGKTRRHRRVVHVPTAGRQDAAERSAANANLPIFIAHGSYDSVVPQPLGMASRDTLAQLGFAIEWHSYPMAHQVCAEEIADLRAWIALRLTA